jgi:hypothetical protein
MTRSSMPPTCWHRSKPGRGGVAAGQSERGEFNFAVRNFRVALFLDSSNPHFWGDLGQIELAESRYESAYRAFSEAMKLGRGLSSTTIIEVFRRKVSDAILTASQTGLSS